MTRRAVLPLISSVTGFYSWNIIGNFILKITSTGFQKMQFSSIFPQDTIRFSLSFVTILHFFPSFFPSFLEVRNELKIKDMLKLLVLWCWFFLNRRMKSFQLQKELNKKLLFCFMNWEETLYAALLLMFLSLTHAKSYYLLNRSRYILCPNRGPVPQQYWATLATELLLWLLILAW